MQTKLTLPMRFVNGTASSGIMKVIISIVHVLLATRVEDILGEEEGQKTGWLVKNHKQRYLVFTDSRSRRVIKTQNYLRNPLQSSEMLPGTSTTFSYNGITYTLSANRQQWTLTEIITLQLQLPFGS